MKYRLCGLLVAALVLAGATSSAKADILYGDFSGVNVDYFDTREFNVPDVSILEAPSIAGDDLDFTPTAFEADALASGGAADVKTVKTTFTSTVTAATNFLLNTVFVDISGTFLNVPTGNIVIASGSVIAEDSNGNTIGDSTFEFENVASGIQGTQNYATGTSLDLGGVDEVDLTVVLEVTGLALTDGVARIDVLDADIRFSTSAIPEPAGALVLMVGLVGLVARRRTRA